MSDFKFKQELIEIARQAGRAILDVYHQSEDLEIHQKKDDSPLTQADLAAHKVIQASLEKLTPETPVLSEESSLITWEERKTWDKYWLVDPLDGTKEFIKRNGEFTVNIALIENNFPVYGVVHVPVKNTDYFGGLCYGSYKHDNGETRQIQVKQAVQPPYKVVGSRSHPSARVEALLNKLGEYQIVPMGSSLKLCMVAEGLADFYPRLGPTSEWDTAAAQAVVEGAGGEVTNISAQRLSYNQKPIYLNPEFLVAARAADWLNYLP